MGISHHRARVCHTRTPADHNQRSAWVPHARWHDRAIPYFRDLTLLRGSFFEGGSYIKCESVLEGNSQVFDTSYTSLNSI